ncbi:MAG: IS66 family transposase [Myxococcota bacterium]
MSASSLLTARSRNSLLSNARRAAARSVGLRPKRALPVEDVLHSLDVCPACGGHEFAPISEKVNEEFEFVPADYKRIRHRRETKRCKSCDTVSTAPGPDRVVDCGHYGPGLYAHAVVAKCADSIPIHRLAKSFERNGIPMSRTTWNALFHRAAELLGPIEKRILELVAASSRVNADETPIHIQAPSKCQKGYAWTFIADKLVVYVFAASRSRDVPKSVLGNTQGHLQVDAYSGYNVVCVPNGPDRGGCMSHTRRKFCGVGAFARRSGHRARLRIPANSTTHSGGSRSGIPAEADRLFRSIPITPERSGAEQFRV